MKKVFEISVVALIMTGLAIISTYPLVNNFTTGIPWSAFRGDLKWSLLYRPGDHLQLFYFFWLVKENILGHVPFNANPYEFNMLNGVTAGNDGMTTAPLAFISFLFSPLGDIAAYNCTVITSYVLAGVFMYLLARIITSSKTASFLAAVIFTFVPIRIMGVAGGNQYGFVLFLYPMIFYFMEKTIRSEKILYSIPAGLGIIALSYNEPHLIYYFCLCMAGYLPIRFISLLPNKNKTVLVEPYGHGMRNITILPQWLSLLIIYGAGIAVVFYTCLIMPRRIDEPFFSPTFWWMIGFYPLIFLFLSLLLASVYSRLSNKLIFRQSLAIEAWSMIPLFLLPFLALFFSSIKNSTEQVMMISICAVMAIKLWLLKAHILNMAAHAWKQSMKMKKRLLVFSPILIGLIAVVVLNKTSRTKAIASSTESGGRSLHDVKLYSAQLHDLFEPGSALYTGLLPAVFGVIFLCYLIWQAAGKKSEVRQPNTNMPVFYLLGIVLLVSYSLATGLAMGNKSLYLLFYHYIPFFNVPRVSNRIICVTILVLAFIAAGVAHAVIYRFRTKYWFYGCTVFFLLLTGFQLNDYSIKEPMAITDLGELEDGYRYIKDNIDDGKLLEIPLWPGDSHQSSLYQYYITLDKVKRINGYTPLVSPEYVRTVFYPLYGLNRGQLYYSQYELLHRLDVKYISVHEHVDVFPPKVSPYPPTTTVRRLVNSPYLEYMGPWNVMNKEYKRVHEQLHIFRLKENVSRSDRRSHYEMPIIYTPGSRLRQGTGRITVDEETGRKVYDADPGKDRPGFLVYGPYSGYLPGKYSCYYRVKSSGSVTDEPFAKIEVVRFTKDKKQEVDVLATTELKQTQQSGRYQDYSLDFEISEWGLLEFRVFYYGTQHVSLDRIVVVKKDDLAKPHYLEAELMAGETGRIVQADSASGEKAVEAVPGRDKPGRVVYGPDMKYREGDYAAIFDLKGLDFISGEYAGSPDAAIISVTVSQGEIILAEQKIKTTSLSKNDFKKFSLDFTLNEPEEVGFEVKFTNSIPLQIDGIKIVEKNEIK